MDFVRTLPEGAQRRVAAAISDAEIERALRIMNDYKNRKIGGKR
jgi:hypothetical protein